MEEDRGIVCLFVFKSTGGTLGNVSPGRSVECLCLLVADLSCLCPVDSCQASKVSVCRKNELKRKKTKKKKIGKGCLK